MNWRHAPIYMEAGALLLVVAPGLRWLGLPRTQALLDQWMQAPARPASPRLVGRAIDRVGRRIPRGSGCLPQALVAQAMLVRRGLPATVHLGVGVPGRDFEAHAWTESVDGVVVGGERQREVTPIHRWHRAP
jgi:hypothetical protein